MRSSTSFLASLWHDGRLSGISAKVFAGEGEGGYLPLITLVFSIEIRSILPLSHSRFDRDDRKLVIIRFTGDRVYPEYEFKESFAPFFLSIGSEEERKGGGID